MIGWVGGWVGGVVVAEGGVAVSVENLYVDVGSDPSRADGGDWMEEIGVWRLETAVCRL